MRTINWEKKKVCPICGEELQEVVINGDNKDNLILFQHNRESDKCPFVIDVRAVSIEDQEQYQQTRDGSTSGLFTLKSFEKI